MKIKSQDASANLKERRKENKIKKDAKARIKAERKAEKAAEQSQSQNNVKDVTDLPEISNNTTEQQSIPIYGHNDYKDEDIQQAQPQNKRSKRVFDQNNQSAAQQMNQEDNRITEQPLNELEESEAYDEDAASNSISEAGEVENEAYKIPPLTLLKQPAKQKSTSKAEVQKKGSY